MTAVLAKGIERQASDDAVMKAWQSRTALPLTIIAVVDLIVYCTTTAYDTELPWMFVVDWLIWGLFAGDYAIRVYLLPGGSRSDWIVSHPLDLVAIAFPALRAFRLVGALARLVAVSKRGGIERVVVNTIGISVLCAAVSSAAVLNAERDAAGANILNYSDAVWWAMTSMTTVGYGDRFPVTGEGRVIAGCLMLVGIGLVGSVIATVSALLHSNLAEASSK